MFTWALASPPGKAITQTFAGAAFHYLTLAVPTNRDCRASLPICMCGPFRCCFYAQGRAVVNELAAKAQHAAAAFQARLAGVMSNGAEHAAAPVMMMGGAVLEAERSTAAAAAAELAAARAEMEEQQQALNGAERAAAEAARLLHAHMCALRTGSGMLVNTAWILASWCTSARCRANAVVMPCVSWSHLRLISWDSDKRAADGRND